MDDFDVVLGLDFMIAAQIISILAANCLLFLGERPCIVPTTILPKSGKKILLALQFKKGVKKGEPSYMVMPMYKDKTNSDPVPDGVKRVLQEF